MTIEELFGTLQQAVVGSWRKHLRTAKYGKHKALDEFYKEMPDKVDALIEAWMGANGKKVGKFENLLSSANYNTLSYLGELKKICKQGYELLGENDELKSLLDDIVNLINSTLYKVKELSESKMIDLMDYLNESLVNDGVSKNDMKEIRKHLYGTVDYFYQEGVYGYDDMFLRAIAKGKKKADYADIVKSTIGDIPDKYNKILKAYLDNGDCKDEIESAVDDIIKEIDAGNTYF